MITALFTTAFGKIVAISGGSWTLGAPCSLNLLPCFLLMSHVLFFREKDFHEFAEFLESVKSKGHITVVASPGDVEAANAKRPGLLNPLSVL